MIKVVVIDDNAEIVSDLERILYFEPDIEVVGNATTGEEGIRVVRDTSPDVVLLDINMPGMDGLATAEALSSSMPNVQIIMISVQDDFDHLRRAMLAGARDYIVKPFSIDEVPAKIRHVYSLGMAERTRVSDTGEGGQNGRVITVFGPRGGCGCTTVAVNVAVALRESTEHGVVVVDADLQFGDVGVMLNLQSRGTIVDLAEHIDDLDLTFVKEITVPHSSGIRALLAPLGPESAELVSGEAARRILRALRSSFDFVVVDGGHVLNDVFLASLDETDELVLLTTPDIPSIKSTRLILDVLDALSYSGERVRLVVTQAGRRYGVTVEDIQASLKCHSIVALPYDDARPVLATNQGRPLVEVAPDVPLSHALQSLAEMLVGATEEPTRNNGHNAGRKDMKRSLFSFLERP